MTAALIWGKNLAPKFQALPHPHVEGAHTITGPGIDFAPIIASKANAERIAAARNLQRRATI